MADDVGQQTNEGASAGPDAEFWPNLQVFPPAVADPATSVTYAKRANSLLVGLRLGNLRHISDRLKVEYAQDQDLPQELAHGLMQSRWSKQLIYLAAFLRPRVNAVVEFFEDYFDSAQGRRVESLIKDKAKRSTESLKPFTKLLEIYLNNPDDLKLIQFLSVWRRERSWHEYEIEGAVGEEALRKLDSGIDMLRRKLDGTSKAQSFECRGTVMLKGNYKVFMFHRNYQASVKPDYKSRYRFQHDYTKLVFGIAPDKGRLIIKVRNGSIRTAIRDWVKDTLDVKLVHGSSRLFQDYDGSIVSSVLTGEYDDKWGIDIVSMSFKHSSLPAGGPIMLGSPEYSRSIREELKYLKKRGALRLSSLSDLEALTIRFRGALAPIEVDSAPGSGVTMRLDDAGLSEPYVEDLRAAFSNAFGIPLNRPIDPTFMATGTTDIYHFLLSGVYQSDVRRHHRKHLDRLIKGGFLQETEVKYGSCAAIYCARKGQQIQDPRQAECPACGENLKIEIRKRYVPDPKKISTKVRRLIQTATGWELSQSQKSFESQPYYQLQHPQSPNKMVCVFMGERVTEGRIEVFRRSHFPILYIHPAGEQRLPVVDASNIAHVGFPYALAAMADESAKRGFRAACKNVLRELLQREQERILGAARHSIASLREKGHEYDDRMFETDIFNVLRRLFLYAMKWGGASKADGFCSLNYYEKNDLGKPVRFNVSYDAKFSKKSYDFGAEEQRQMIDYILTISNSKWLQTQGNRYDGHMIITNSMEESAMQNAADYLWANHRLSKDRPDFLVVFMREGFLTRIYDLIHDNSEEMSKRWAMFPETVVEWIKSSGRGGYKLIDENTADGIIEHLLEGPAVDNPVNLDFLLKDVTRLITQRTNVPSVVPKPSAN